MCFTLDYTKLPKMWNMTILTDVIPDNNNDKNNNDNSNNSNVCIYIYPWKNSYPGILLGNNLKRYGSPHPR